MTPWQWNHQWHMKKSGWVKRILGNSGRWRQTLPPPSFKFHRFDIVAGLCFILASSPNYYRASCLDLGSRPPEYHVHSISQTGWCEAPPNFSPCSLQHDLARPHFLSSKFVWPRLACRWWFQGVGFKDNFPSVIIKPAIRYDDTIWHHHCPVDCPFSHILITPFKVVHCRKSQWIWLYIHQSCATNMLGFATVRKMIREWMNISTLITQMLSRDEYCINNLN